MIADALNGLDLPDPVRKGLIAAGTTVVSAATGGSVGAAAGFNQVANNYLNHEQILAKEKALADCGTGAAAGQCRSDVQKAYNQLSRDNTKRLENCSDTNSCRAALAEISADYTSMSARRDELQALDYSGKATPQQRQESMDLNLNIDSAFGGGSTLSATAEQTWRQLRATTPYNNLTDAEKSKTFADAMMTLGGLGAAGAVGGVRGVTQGPTSAEVAAQGKAVEQTKINIDARTDDAQQYVQFQTDKGWDWQKQAPNNGAVPGTSQTVTVQTGQTLDRYGSRYGEYMSPSGTAYESRSLPPGKSADPYEQYSVLKPFVVVREEIAPAFGQPGGGIQMRAQIPEVQNRYATIDDLIKNGYLKDPKK